MSLLLSWPRLFWPVLSSPGEYLLLPAIIYLWCLAFMKSLVYSSRRCWLCYSFCLRLAVGCPLCDVDWFWNIVVVCSQVRPTSTLGGSVLFYFVFFFKFTLTNINITWYISDSCNIYQVAFNFILVKIQNKKWKNLHLHHTITLNLVKAILLSIPDYFIWSHLTV